MEEKQEQNTSLQPEKKKESLFETIRFIVISLVLVFGFRYFIAQPFIVSGDSMVPTFHDGEYLIVDELTYRFEKPKRYDVIIMRYPLEPKKFFIKRIVGLPGETLEFAGATINITAPDKKKIEVSEPYVKNQGLDFITITLDANEYFVLGDNRASSSDSRRWGPLPAANIVGRPVVRLLPMTKISWWPGTVTEIANE